LAARFAPVSVCLAVAREIDKDWLAVMVAAASFLATVGTLMFLSWHASTLAGSLRRANRQLVHLGTHDALTGLPNRLLLAQSVDDAIEQATHDDAAFALFFIDLDGFKAINDSIGHAAGDELLKVCATRLTQRLRKTDIVARLGGDEFVVVSNHLRDIAVVDAIAAGLLLALSEEAVIRGAPLRVSASIGVATYPRDGGTTQALLHAADVAMYEAKQGGRNAWRRFDHAMLANAHRMLRLQIDLAAAVGQGQLAVDFQPKFSVRDRAMTGAEALLRWHHPEFGVIAPMEFIPLAERSGQIGEIGDWVLREVCRELTGWHAEGLAPLTISINLSAAQFNAPDLVDRICAIVAAERVSPRCLVFEITETVAMQNGERAAATIGRLRENGLETVIADFGAGYTSLAYLRRFQVRQIKVDPFFVHQLDHHGHEGRALLEAIITLSHALNMEVVAEGVETAAQLDSLASLHCDEVQGFQVSRPLATALFRQCRLALNAKNAGSGLGAAPWYDDLGTLFNQGEPREPMTQ
jgi:diguanylate cyclase (GGDEF)-like protein